MRNLGAFWIRLSHLKDSRDSSRRASRWANRRIVRRAKSHSREHTSKKGANQKWHFLFQEKSQIWFSKFAFRLTHEFGDLKIEIRLQQQSKRNGVPHSIVCWVVHSNEQSWIELYRLTDKKSGSDNKASANRRGRAQERGCSQRQIWLSSPPIRSARCGCAHYM